MLCNSMKRVDRPIIFGYRVASQAVDTLNREVLSWRSKLPEIGANLQRMGDLEICGRIPDGLREEPSEKAGASYLKGVDRPQLAKHDIKLLDLAFAMDCTGSMGSYIDSARENIRKIVEDIVASEKGDVRLALVEYRDHPPQDDTFVTRVHDFTSSVGTMKQWLTECSADGGGDAPEAVADALHDLLKLSWRQEATKISVLISDAPPHGLSNAGGEGFPNGCPAGIDPMRVSRQLAEKGITLYVAGCEPSIRPYKDFFLAIAFVTGGQYVPLTKAQLLTRVIVGGAQEEMSLEQFMAEVDDEVQAEVAAGRDIDEEEITRMVHGKMKSKGIKAKQLRRNKEELMSADAAPRAKKYANMECLADIRKEYKLDEPEMFEGGSEIRLAMCPPPVMVCPMAPPRMMRCPMPRGRSSPETAMAEMSLDDDETNQDLQMAEENENYELVEDDISYGQASRMVQKSIARNFGKKRAT